MSSSEHFDWVPAIVGTFLVLFMTTMVVVVLRLPRKVTVSELNVYPIKSCGPMTVSSAEVTPTGFCYDRFAQVSDSKGNYLTPRDAANARLFHVNPTIVKDERTSDMVHLRLAYGKHGNDADVDTEPFRIHNLQQEIERSTTKEVMPIVGPKVTVKDLGDDVARWLSKATQIWDCRLTAIGPQYQRSVEVNPNQGEAVPFRKGTQEIPPPLSLADEAPFLLTTTASLDDLNARLAVRGKQPVGMQRFRPNIVVGGTFAWEEDTWKRIRIGSVEFEVWQRCGPPSIERPSSGGQNHSQPSQRFGNGRTGRETLECT